MDDPSIIPAATIQDVDLSDADPVLSAEIRRLGDLMERGEETSEQFAQLIRLLVRVGRRKKAEYLLRRNMEGTDDGQDLYRTLFGTAKQDEFAAAIEGFQTQFEVGLEFAGSRGFLDAEYLIRPRSLSTAPFRQLIEPCEVRFDFADPDEVTADVCGQSDVEYLLLRWVGGEWQSPDGSRV